MLYSYKITHTRICRIGAIMTHHNTFCYYFGILIGTWRYEILSRIQSSHELYVWYNAVSSINCYRIYHRIEIGQVIYGRSLTEYNSTSPSPTGKFQVHNIPYVHIGTSNSIVLRILQSRTIPKQVQYIILHMYTQVHNILLFCAHCNHATRSNRHTWTLTVAVLFHSLETL